MLEHALDTREPSTMDTERTFRYPAVLLLFTMVAVIAIVSRTSFVSQGTRAAATQSGTGVISTDDALMADLSVRMRRRDLNRDNTTQFGGIVGADGVRANPKQLYLLHHMKTGGTSVNVHIGCALKRARNMSSLSIGYYSISECNPASYAMCQEQYGSIQRNDTNKAKHDCASSLDTSTVISFCNPLAIVNQWQWGDVDAITMLRDPVDRVWSM